MTSPKSISPSLLDQFGLDPDDKPSSEPPTTPRAPLNPATAAPERTGPVEAESAGKSRDLLTPAPADSREQPAGIPATGEIKLDSDPFAASKGADEPSKVNAGAGVSEVQAAGAIVSASGAPIDPELVKEFKGIEILAEVGLDVPKLSFDYDPSDEAAAKRAEEKVKEFMAAGMPEAPAKLRAQLAERELKNKKNRAMHSRKRSIVRLIQEARLKKDAFARDQRLEMLKMKQEATKSEMAKNEEERRKAEAEKEAERKTYVNVRVQDPE